MRRTSAVCAALCAVAVSGCGKPTVDSVGRRIGGVWTVDLKENPGVREGDEGKADCTLEIAAADWTSISGNPGAAMQLYLTGKLKVTGNAMLATKLQSILA